MAERILKNISTRGLKNAVKGNEYRKEALDPSATSVSMFGAP